MKCSMILLLIAAAICSSSFGNSETNNPTKLLPSSYNGLTAKTPAHILRVLDEKQVQGDKDTNGWSCVLRLSNSAGWTSLQPPPVCDVIISNISANTIRCWGGVDGIKYSRIALLNSNAVPVEKTLAGKAIGTWADNKNIKEMVKARFKLWIDGRARTPGYIRVRPGQSCGIGISLPQLFELKQSGEYTLKVQTCLIEKVGGEEYEPDLRIRWLPEVVTELDIQSSNHASQGESFSK